MWGHFGFTYVGLVYMIMLTIPNLIWIKHQPIGYEEVVVNENKVLLLFERVGQMLVTCIVVIFGDFNLVPFSPWSIWLIISFVLMIIYEISWIRYSKSKHTLKDFYGSMWGIPVPGASLPVVAFFLLGVYGKIIWLMISITILGIGHIGIHLQHRKECREKEKFM
jgi:hypothetical protein